VLRTQSVHVARHSLCAALLVALTSTLAGAQALPAPWTSADVGAPALSGSATYSSGTFTISAAGADIWRGSDQFHFVYQTITGDVEIIARVGSLTAANEWSKAGVMIRESLAATSRHAMMVASVANGYAFQRRVETGGVSSHTGGPATAPPGWVRLVRTGDLFQGYQSTDGVTWRFVGSETIPMGETVYVGLPVTSHNTSARTTAAINNVRVIASQQPPNQPPAVSITSPAFGTHYMAPATVGIAASASDPEGEMLSVDFYVDSTLISRDTTAPYAASWSTSAAGTHNLTAVAHDAAGGSTTSAAVSITVGTNAAPSVSLTGPANGATFTAPATINLAANAADPDGQIARVEFFSGTTRLSTDTTAPYTFSWTSVPAGSYALTALAFDNLGASTRSVAANVTVNAPSGGLPDGQQAGDIGSPSIAGSTSYANGSYTVRAGGSDIWRGSDQFHFVYRQVSGDTELIARVASLTNADPWSKVGVMVRQSLAANSQNVLMLLSAANGYSFQRRATAGGATVSSRGSLDTAPGWVRLVRRGNAFEAYESADGSAWVLVGTDTIAMPASVYVGLAVTSHNTAVATTAVVDNFRVVGPSGNQPPTVALSSPVGGATYSAPATISFAASASDPENRLARVEFSNGSTVLGSDTSSPFTFSWTNVAAGTYSLTATAYDSDGATATSAAVTVTVNGANGAPTVSLTSPATGATFTAPASITIAASASDPENQLSRVEFLNGQTLLGSDTSAPYTWSWTNVAAGSYTLTAVAVDAAGNRTTSTAVSVTVSTSTSTPPRLVVFTASSDHATNVTSYRFDVFTSTANPNTATAVATANLGKPAPAANNDITVDQSTLFSNLAPGSYIATVTAIGPGGSTRSATVAFTR
jgi:regulation of enolase protein 1 (concanavalin A-like superfamily)